MTKKFWFQLLKCEDLLLSSMIVNYSKYLWVLDCWSDKTRNLKLLLLENYIAIFKIFYKFLTFYRKKRLINLRNNHQIF